VVAGNVRDVESDGIGHDDLRLLDVGNWILEAGNWRPVMGSSIQLLVSSF
jgi:hypothetical protein